LTPALLARLQAHKPELLAMLAGGPQDLQPQDDHSDAAGWQEYIDPDGRRCLVRSDLADYEIIDLPTPCTVCGGIVAWWDLAGGQHCERCHPRTTGERLRQRAALARTRHPIGAPKTWPLPGADDVLRLAPNDLPQTPWHFDGLGCYDNGRLLNELRIDLLVLGPCGVNNRSGRLAQDIERILHVAQRLRHGKEPTR
jgi:hypothetical protein